MSGKRPSKYFHRHDHARGKDKIIAARKAEATPKRVSSPETWIETVENAFRHDCGAVLDHLQVRALRRDYNDLIRLLEER